MNWQFWKQKSVPAAPVVKQNEVTEMTEVESAIFADLIRSPEAWQVRPMALVGSFRADRGGVTISSVKSSPLVCPGAVCGKMVFGPGFSALWHEVIVTRWAEKEIRDNQVEAARVEAELVRMFVK
jgi:hypothetical protein